MNSKERRGDIEAQTTLSGKHKKQHIPGTATSWNTLHHFESDYDREQRAPSYNRYVQWTLRVRVIMYGAIKASTRRQQQIEYFLIFFAFRHHIAISVDVPTESAKYHKDSSRDPNVYPQR